MVTFDNKLAFLLPHINKLINSLYRTLGFIICNSRDFDNIETVKLPYFSYVRYRLEYASLIWLPYYNVHINRLESIQRRVLKYLSYKITGLYPVIGFPHNNLLSCFSFNFLKDRRTAAGQILLHTIINGTIDCPNIFKLFLLHVLRTSATHNYMLLVKMSRTNLMKNSPMVKICERHNNVLGTSIDMFFCNFASIKGSLCDLPIYLIYLC